MALQNINGETLQTVEGNKEGDAQENYCVEVADTLQPIQGIKHISDSLLPPINAPNNEEVVLESEISIPNSVSVFDLFDLQIRELQEKEVQGLAGNDNSTFNSNNSGPDFTHRNHYVINQGFMSEMVTEEQSNMQLNETEVELDKSDHQDFISFNPCDFDSRAPTCTSVQTQKKEARGSHDAARVPTPDTPLRVLPKRSRRVREVLPRQGQKMNLFQVNNVMHLTWIFVLIYLLKGNTFIRVMLKKFLNWRRLIISPARTNELLSMELSWAWEPAYRKGACRDNTSERSICRLFS